MLDAEAIDIKEEATAIELIEAHDEAANNSSKSPFSNTHRTQQHNNSTDAPKSRMNKVKAAAEGKTNRNKPENKVRLMFAATFRVLGACGL